MPWANCHGSSSSATTEELVKQGYKVRAATRQATRAGAFVTKLEKLYGQGALEIVEIADLTAPGAYTQALQGHIGLLTPCSSSLITATLSRSGRRRPPRYGCILLCRCRQSTGHCHQCDRRTSSASSEDTKHTVRRHHFVTGGRLHTEIWSRHAHQFRRLYRLLHRSRPINARRCARERLPHL